MKQWISQMFSENGVPSSSRVLTFILSIGSLLCIFGVFIHIWTQTVDKQAVWLAQMPWIIGSLTAFSTSPYAINKGGSTLSDLFKNKKEDHQ